MAGTIAERRGTRCRARQRRIAAILFFGALGLAIYGAGAVLNGRHFGRPLRLLVAGICVLVCLALIPNVVDAVREQRLNALASETCG